MSDNEIKHVEGELVDKPRDDAKSKGVFIGTLNIMAAPAREYVTKPLHQLYHARYHGRYRRPKHVFAFDLGLIALGAALAAVAIYFSFLWKPVEETRVKFAALPKSPVSGGEVVLNLDVANNGKIAMNDAVATFRLPKEISFVRSSPPLRRDTESIKLGTIEPGTNIKARIVGTLNGKVGQELRPTVTVSYKEGLDGPAKTKNAEASLKISSSSVGAAFELPDSLFAGQAINGAIRYWNRGNAPAEKIVIVPAWPEGFALSSSSLPLKSGRWEIGTLAPNSEGQISWTGSLAGTDDSADFAADIGSRSGNSINVEAQSIKNVTVTDAGIILKIDGPTTAKLGDTLTLTGSWKSASGHSLAPAAVKILADDGFSYIEGSGKDAIAIESGATNGSWQFKMKMDDTIPEALKGKTDPQFKVRVAISGEIDGAEEATLQSPAFAVRIVSSLGLSSVARYWSETGDQLGRGPIPPEVGKATRYWIFWNIKNTTGAVTGVRVYATLPANASFTGKVSAPFGEAPQFDPGTRTVTWSVGDIPAWPGMNSASIGTAFEVALIPTPDQAGIYPLLVGSQKIAGNDSTSGLPLQGSAKDITTHLTDDPKAAGTGTVK